MTATHNFLSTLTGVFASPVAENPTGVMVEAAYRHHGVAARYVSCDVAPENLEAAVRGAVAMGWVGFNCSLPHKVAVMAFLDEIAESAALIGAVNCVVVREGRLVGENTDGQGFLASLRATVELSNMEDILSEDFELILLTPVDSDAAVASVEMANAAGVPVVTFDRGVSGGEVVSHIASDNEAGGKMAAEYIAEQFPDGANVVELQGILATDVAKQRGGGFAAGLEEAGNLELVAQQSANFDKAQGFTVFENILQANDQVDAVFAHNDEMALGAMQAAQAANRTDIVIVGFDANAEAVAAVEAGQMAATLAQLPDKIVQTAIDTALSYLAGETVEPEIRVELQLVTK